MNNKTHIRKFQEYLQGESKSEMTIYTYTQGIKYFLSYIGKDAENITNEDIRNYKTHMVGELKYSKNSLIVRYASVRSFFEYLGKPLGKKILPFPKRTEVIKIPLTEEDIQRLFEASKEDKRNHAILKVLYYTGLRRFEVVNLNVGDINTKDEILYVYGGKGNSNKAINIHKEAIDSVVEYLKVREPRNPDEKALFLNQDGYRLGRQSIQRIVKNYASKARITKRIYPHLFRVSLATHMAENGCSLEEIRLQTRHTGFEVLKGYIQMSPKHLKEAYIKGISLTKQPQEIHKQDIQNPKPDTHQPEINTPKQDTPIPKQETKQSLEHEYIQLFREGRLSKEEFMKLMISEKTEASNYIY